MVSECTCPSTAGMLVFRAHIIALICTCESLLPGLMEHILRTICVHLPPRNFITLHYAYFIGTCLVASIVFWGPLQHLGVSASVP